MYKLQYRLRITYHGDESCGGWGGGARFTLEFDDRNEWLRRVNDACKLISETLDVNKESVMGNALAFCEARRPTAYKTVDLFVPCDRKRLESVFGVFSPHPVGRG